MTFLISAVQYHISCTSLVAHTLVRVCNCSLLIYPFNCLQLTHLHFQLLEFFILTSIRSRPAWFEYWRIGLQHSCIDVCIAQFWLWLLITIVINMDWNILCTVYRHIHPVILPYGPHMIHAWHVNIWGYPDNVASPCTCDQPHIWIYIVLVWDILTRGYVCFTFIYKG